MISKAFLTLIALVVISQVSKSQIENVPVSNQVYEFLNRMGVKGILPAYSNAMIPYSRREVGEMLVKIDSSFSNLSKAEMAFLTKFKREFMHELDPAKEENSALFRDGFAGENYLENEKFLYDYRDSSVSLYVEFLGSLEYRGTETFFGDLGPSSGVDTSFSAVLEQHGGRIRGTIKDRLGYFLQGTNGTVFGDKAFAMTDPALESNNKLKEPASNNFDFTEAYLRADLIWFNLEFGRERNLVGTGYSDQLMLSDNAPAFDLLKLDFHYKAVRYMFLHGSLVEDSAAFPGTLAGEPEPRNKYMAMHRLQISLWDVLNVGLSEMTIYQRTSPEWAYLNPINFYKSAEHAEGDRDNSFLNFDIEVFPMNGVKLYSTLLVDDIDFSKLGTTWWGNELGMQGGAFFAEPFGINNVDVVAEYTRIEPYVYSNRTDGLAYTNNNMNMGDRIGPNSDEWFFQVQFRPSASVRGWLAYSNVRHGENIIENGIVTKNVGGNPLQGHRSTDSEEAPFLDGNLVRYQVFQMRWAYEPVNNIILYLTTEFRGSTVYPTNTTSVDSYGSLRLQVEY